MKKLLVIVGLVVLAFVAVIALLMVANKDRMVRFASERALGALESSMSRSMADRSRVEAVRRHIEQVKKRFSKGEISFDQIRSLVGAFPESYRDRSLDSLQIARYEKELLKLAGD
jgi:hypothetical protein